MKDSSNISIHSNQSHNKSQVSQVKHNFQQENIMKTLVEVRESLKTFLDSIKETHDFSIFLLNTENLIENQRKPKENQLKYPLSMRKEGNHYRLYKKLESFLYNKRKIKFNVIRKKRRIRRKKEKSKLVLKKTKKKLKKYKFLTYYKEKDCLKYKK